MQHKSQDRREDIGVFYLDKHETHKSECICCKDLENKIFIFNNLICNLLQFKTYIQILYFIR